MTTITAVPSKDRIFSMDLIRGVAILGILLMNIPGFASHEFPLMWGDAQVGHLTLNGFIVKSSMIVFDGKMRGLFTILFGAGIMLFMENKKSQSIEVADAYFKRMMWLLMFGFVDAYILLWGGDVLYEYALCGIFLFALRNIRVRWMLLISFIMLSFFLVKSGMPYWEAKDKSVVYKEVEQLMAQGKKVSEEKQAIHDDFKKNILDFHMPQSKVAMDRIRQDIRENYIGHTSSDYLAMAADNAGGILETQSYGFYTSFMETMGTILLGMALYKLGFFHFRWKKRTYVLWSVFGILVGWGLYALAAKLNVKTQAEIWEAYSWRPCSTFYLEHPGRILLIIGYASLLMLIAQAASIRKFLNLIANTGRMALTNYIMQTILCSIWFLGIGFSNYGKYDAKGLILFCSIIWIIQITYSSLWLKYFEMGPLEWLWKRLTYGRGVVRGKR